MAALSQAKGRALYGKAGWEAASDTELWFSHMLTHTEGSHAGQPFVPYDWQCLDVIYPIFGRLGPDGLREVQTAYIEIPKKNGKSLLGSGIALKCLLADGEVGAHVASAAGSKEQAKVVFGTAAVMVEQEPELRDRCRVYKNVIEGPYGGIYEAISAEAYTKHGPSFSAVIFDELHTQPNRDLWDTVTPGTMARDQGLVFAISTAGNRKTGICWEMHQRALAAMADPKADPTFYAKVYSFDETKYKWDSEEAFASCNPSYLKSIKRRAWLGLIAKAKQTEADQASYRQLHLNQWLDTTSQTWIPSEVFAQCA